MVPPPPGGTRRRTAYAKSRCVLLVTKRPFSCTLMTSLNDWTNTLYLSRLSVKHNLTVGEIERFYAICVERMPLFAVARRNLRIYIVEQKLIKLFDMLANV